MTTALDRLQRFVDGEAATAVYGAAAGDLMRADVAILLAHRSGLAWFHDWDQARLGEQVLLLCEVAGDARDTVLLARLYQFKGPAPRDAVVSRLAGAGWIAWQSTWDGTLLPKAWRPVAFARVTAPPEGSPR